MQQLLMKLNTLAADFGVQAYLVGGAVRDRLLGRAAHDVDLAVAGDVFAFSRYIAAELAGSCIPLDRVNGTARVVLKNRDDAVRIDISQLKGADIADDLAKRDFTINALAASLDDRQLIDPFNGRSDLAARSIVMVSPQAFAADPLRVLRGFRLAAELNFSVEAHTLKKMAAHAGGLAEVSGERILEELAKLLGTAHSYRYIDLADKEMNLWTHVFPLVDEMRATAQNYYHRDNVWEHGLKTLRCLEEIADGELSAALVEALQRPLAGSRPLLFTLKTACLLHDIGKPAAAGRRADGRITFHGHEKKGAAPVQEFIERVKLANKEAGALKLLIRQHMRPLWLYSQPKVTNTAKFRLYRDLGLYYAPCLMLSLADVTATYLSSGRLQEIKAYRRYIFDLLNCVFPPPLIDGSDLKEHLGLSASKTVGRLLQAVREAQAEGTVTTREQALELAAKLLKK